MTVVRVLLILVVATVGLAAAGPADATPPGGLRDVDFEQKLGARLPAGASFVDASGASATLGQYFGARPVFLVMAYYRCPNLCGVMLRTVAQSLAPLDLVAGRDFDVVTISIDPHEGPDAAQEARRDLLEAYDRPGSEAGWHVLTGAEQGIRAVADAIGFRYAYDDDLGQYVHPAGLTLLTSEGRVARYFYGLEYLGRDLRLGLVEASGGRIGNPVDRVLLLCYGYDPATGKYTFMVTNALRIAGAGTVAVLASFIGVQLMRERRRRAAAADTRAEARP